MLIQCICLNAIWSIHILIYIYIYIGFHCIVFNIISGRVMRWKPQLHCEEFLNIHLLAAWFRISHSSFIPLCEPFANRIVERSKVDGIWEWPNSLTTQATRDRSSRASSNQMDAQALVAQKSLFFLGKWMAQSHSCHQMLPPPWLQNTNCN